MEDVLCQKIDYQDLSAKIMDNIGGVKNVKTVTTLCDAIEVYCMIEI